MDTEESKLGDDIDATLVTEGSDTEVSAKLTCSSANHMLTAVAKFARTRIGRLLQALVLIAAVTEISYLATRKETEEIEMQFDGAEFGLEDLSLREKVSQLMVGSPYDSRAGYMVDNAFAKLPLSVDFTDWLSDWLKTSETTGGVHIFNSDARTLTEANRTIVELYGRSKIPPFISMDVVGGYTRHLGVTAEEAEKFGVPDRFMKMAKVKKLALPTQEDIGREFSSLKTVKERIGFRKDLEAYGAAIGRLCRDLGVSIDFAPVLDIVEDIDGKNFMEHNDQSYGENAYTVQILGFHFMKGFQSIEGVMVAPKHFFGTGKSPNDPHKNEDQKITGTEITDGTVLPFKDAVTGRLFYDGIIRGYRLDKGSFDFHLRHHLRAIRNAKRRGHEKILEKARRAYAVFLKRNGFTIDDIPEDFMDMPRVGGMMVSHSQNFTNPDTPGTISSEMVERRLRQKLGFRGIAFSDDLNMGATERHVTEHSPDCGDWPAEVFADSLAAGVTMPMLLHHSGEIDAIVARVKLAIDTQEDFDGDGTPDVTMARIDSAVRQVLERKVSLGLLTKTMAPNPDKRTLYRNNSREYLRRTLHRR